MGSKKADHAILHESCHSVLSRRVLWTLTLFILKSAIPTILVFQGTSFPKVRCPLIVGHQPSCNGFLDSQFVFRLVYTQASRSASIRLLTQSSIVPVSLRLNFHVSPITLHSSCHGGIRNFPSYFHVTNQRFPVSPPSMSCFVPVTLLPHDAVGGNSIGCYTRLLHLLVLLKVSHLLKQAETLQP